MQLHTSTSLLLDEPTGRPSWTILDLNKQLNGQKTSKSKNLDVTLTVSSYFPTGYPAHRRHAGQDGRARGGKAPGGHRHPGPCPHRHRRLWHRLWQRRIWGLLTAPVTPIPISPPTCKRGAQRGARGSVEGPPQKYSFFLSPLFLSLYSSHLHTGLTDSMTWKFLGGGGELNKNGKKKKKKKSLQEMCRKNRTSTLMYTHTVHYNSIALW